MLKRIAVCTVFLSTFLIAQPVFACVEIEFHAAPVTANYSISLPTGSPAFANPKLGIYQWIDVGGPYIYEAFCIDLETSGTGGPVVYDCVALTDARDPLLTGGQLSVHRADLIKLLWGQFRGSITSVDEAVAFHLAIYEIVYDGDALVFDGTGFIPGGQDFAGGLFDGTDGGSTQWAIAEAWLYALNEAGAAADLIAWHSDERQDQIVERHFYPIPVQESTWGQIKSLYR